MAAMSGALAERIADSDQASRAACELSKGGASKSNALAVRLAPYVEGTGWRTFFAFSAKMVTARTALHEATILPKAH